MNYEQFIKANSFVQKKNARSTLISHLLFLQSVYYYNRQYSLVFNKLRVLYGGYVRYFRHSEFYNGHVRISVKVKVHSPCVFASFLTYTAFYTVILYYSY